MSLSALSLFCFLSFELVIDLFSVYRKSELYFATANVFSFGCQVPIEIRSEMSLEGVSDELLAASEGEEASCILTSLETVDVRLF